MITSKVYAKFPVLYKNFIIFTTNNTLYKYNRDTHNIETMFCSQTEIKYIQITKNRLIFVNQFEGGPDIYSMNLTSKKIERLTFTEDNKIKPLLLKENKVIFSSNEHSPFWSSTQSYELDLETKEIKELNYHSIYSFSINQNTNDIYVQKDEYGYLFWKNYQGGARGKIYKNEDLLIDLPGQCISPIYHNDQIYFIYENNNDTNIFSCDTNGKNLQQHTNHKEFKIQNINLNNNEIVYTQIGNIYIFDTHKKTVQKIKIDLNIIQPNRNQSINLEYLTSIENNDKKIICAIRGNIFEKNLYSGQLKQISSELRYTHIGFINEKIFGIKDGRETELHIFENDETIKYKLESQKIHEIAVSSKNWIALANHKCELTIMNEKGESKTIAKNQNLINSFEWSKDGQWLVYELNYEEKSSIVIYSLEENVNRYLINDEYHNTNPSIDSENRFIAFLSSRNIEIKSEDLRFDYRCDIKENAYYVPLKIDYNMLTPWTETKEEKSLNFEKIADKIKAIPIKHKLKNIKVIDNQVFGEISKNETILFSLKTLTEEIKKEIYDELLITNHKKSLVKFTNNVINVHPIAEKTDENSWQNVKFEINNLESNISTVEERSNIFEELTWLMEEFFWSKENVFEFKDKVQNYRQFLEKIKTEEELIELLDQIQGEMKTSHAYVAKKFPKTSKGYLAIKTEKIENNELKITNFLKSTTKIQAHPILSLNSHITIENKLKKINNKKINHNNLDQTLIGTSNNFVSIEFENTKSERKEYDVKTIDFATYKRWLYENWVQENEKYVSQQGSEIAYMHIGDMGKQGFIDFFTKYVNIYKKKAIIIDIRYNTGGHISTLLLEQLSKKKTGIGQSRHFESSPIPHFTTEGKYVLLINEQTASDGEIFAENFKVMNLGPIIGERTWGGVVGIMPRYKLINNLKTTQPEFATVFNHNEQGIENYGVTPDIKISNKISEKITPKNDAQLNKAIEICLNF